MGQDNNATPRIWCASFSETELTAWRNGDYSLVKDCSKPLQQRLREKAKARPGRRFFGEAKVLASEPYDDAWYGSFKWLTSPKWIADQKLADGYQEGFRTALQHQFRDLPAFQQAVALAMTRIGGDRPVGPDLWLISQTHHRFIEVKLPGDRLARRQLIGLALISKFLRCDRTITVEIVNLSLGQAPRASADVECEFAGIYKKLPNVSASALGRVGR
jgi:hypothetical protein